MANSFKKSAPLVNRKKDNKWITSAVILIILLLLLGTVVPLDKVPGVRSALVSMGFDDIDNRGVTLARFLTGSSNLKISSYGGGGRGGIGGGYDANRSDLSYTLSAVSPFDDGPLGATYLLDAQRLREAAYRSGSNAVSVSRAAGKTPDGYFESSDYLVDASKFNAAQQGLVQGDVPLAREPSEGPPVESSLSKLTGGENIASFNPQITGNISDMSKDLGTASRGKIKQMINPRDTSRRGRAPLGDLKEFGAEPLNQAGTSWLFTRAGDRAKIQESKKTLARAAFDGSVRPDEVVLKKDETAATVSDQASINKDAAQFESDKLKTKVCQDAMKKYNGEPPNDLLKKSRDNLQQLSVDLQGIVPQCCLTVNDACHNGDSGESAWFKKLDAIVTECNNYNQIQSNINKSCGLSVSSGRGDCAAIKDPSGRLSECTPLESASGTLTGYTSAFSFLGNPVKATVESNGKLASINTLNQFALIDSKLQ
ncbi:MAG: hypothetical protein LBI01_03495 [Elusimicrobium sp.]|jgi:hypothetical protein|nr:hypothetical protein [Elusimicrobium sp.]